MVELGLSGNGCEFGVKKKPGTAELAETRM